MLSRVTRLLLIINYNHESKLILVTLFIMNSFMTVRATIQRAETTDICEAKEHLQERISGVS